MQESKGIKNIFKSDNFGIFVALIAVIFVFTAAGFCVKISTNVR